MLRLRLTELPAFAAFVIGSALVAFAPGQASAQTPETRCIVVPGAIAPGISVQAGFDYLIDHSGNRDKCRVKNTSVTVDPYCPLGYHLQRRTGRDRCSR